MAARKSRPTSTKFNREAKLRERRRVKDARRDARRHGPAEPHRASETAEAGGAAPEETPAADGAGIETPAADDAAVHETPAANAAGTDNDR